MRSIPRSIHNTRVFRVVVVEKEEVGRAAEGAEVSRASAVPAVPAVPAVSWSLRLAEAGE